MHGALRAPHALEGRKLADFLLNSTLDPDRSRLAIGVALRRTCAWREVRTQRRTGSDSGCPTPFPASDCGRHLPTSCLNFGPQSWLLLLDTTQVVSAQRLGRQWHGQWLGRGGATERREREEEEEKGKGRAAMQAPRATRRRMGAIKQKRVRVADDDDDRQAQLHGSGRAGEEGKAGIKEKEASDQAEEEEQASGSGAGLAMSLQA